MMLEAIVFLLPMLKASGGVNASVTSPTSATPHPVSAKLNKGFMEPDDNGKYVPAGYVLSSHKFF